MYGITRKNFLACFFLAEDLLPGFFMRCKAFEWILIW